MSGFSVVPETDGRMRAVYHYIALGESGLQEPAFYLNIRDTDKDLEDISAFVAETRRKGPRVSISV